MLLYKWMKKIAIQVMAIFLAVCCILPNYSVLASQEVSVEVVLSPKIDLVLTTGITGLDLSKFEEDLIDALERRGVGTSNTDMVEISAIETTSASLESTSVDFVSVVNQWKTVGADTWSATENGEIYSRTPGGQSNPAWWGTGIINPDGFEIDDLKAEFTLVNGGKLNEGFCFNVTQNDDGSLNGYFISYSNHTNTTRALFRFDHYTLDQKFDSGINNIMWCYNKNSWNVGAKHTSGADTFTSLATWTDAGKNINYEVTCKNGQIVIKDNGNVVANVTDNTYPKGTYGFWGNNCEMADFSYVSNLKITATKTVSKDYAQVLLEPKWRAEAAHFVVNVEDPINESLKNPEALARTLADDIHFIQWGSNENKSSAEDFIAKNDGNGIFCDGTDYKKAVEATADYIKKIIDQMQKSNAQYVLIGENIELVVSPESIKVGAVSELFPTGRWLIHHDPTSFDNDEGQSPLTEVFQPDLLCAFDKPGRYEIYFDNEKVKEVYVHRKPIADFNIGIKDGNVTLTSVSYDLDSNNDLGYGKGIAKEEWYYKNAEDDSWLNGKLDHLTANEVYIIKLKVTDMQGVSTETIKYVGIGAPVSNFGLSSNAISTADRLEVQDYSYDPQGYNLTSYEWVLKKGTKVVGTYTTPQFPDLNFNSAGFGEGEYSLSLKVTNTAGDSSGIFTQAFKVDTARYTNQFVHYAIGFQNNEGNVDDGLRFLMQKTYFTQTYGTEFVPATHALAIPNGFYLKEKYSIGDQEYNTNTAVKQPGNAMEMVFEYAPYEYTIEYDLDGGTLEEENITSYTVLYGSPLHKPVKEHYTFLGWYDQNGKKLDGINEGATATFKNTADFYSQLAKRTSGDLKLTARWEYRVYQVSASKYGHGSISNGGTFGEGEEITITWTPDEGYSVIRVMVDGIVRDDLLNGGAGNSITFSEISDNHSVRAEFGKVDPEEEEEPKEYFLIATEQKGGSKDATISKSKTLAEGSDYVVEWQPGEFDEIESITVDGQNYPIEKRNVEFKKISGNHKVVVVYKNKEEKPNTPITEGYYTITVNSQDGDAKRVDTSTTGSAVVKPKEDHTVGWSAKNGYEVASVRIDPNQKTEIVLSEEEILAGSYTFTEVTANHIVEIIFKKDSEEPSDKKRVEVKTELVGGPGQITESATICEGEDYSVQWDSVVKTTEDVDAPDYAVYKVTEVILNGETVGSSENKLELNDIKADQTVRVVMEPVLHQVETVIVGKGSIDPTATLYDGQNYIVNASPEEGWVLKSVVVDDTPVYEKPVSEIISADDIQEKADLSENEILDETIESELAENEDLEESEELSNDGQSEPAVEEQAEISEEEAVLEEEIVPMMMTRELNEVTMTVDDQNDVPVNVQISSITQNHKIHVEFMKEDGTSEDTTNYLNITGRIEGGPGSFVGSGQYEPGSQKTVSWTVPESYEVAAVTVMVNGIQRNDLPINDTSLELKDIQDNYDITVTLKKSGGASNPTDPNPNSKKWSVITAITNGEGEITQSTHDLPDGSDWNVNWDFDDTKFVIKEVRIDGITDDSYLLKKEVNFTNLSSDHSVEIILSSKSSSQYPRPDKKDQYLISTERTQGGTIDSSIRVEKGTNHTIHWSAEPGYTVVSVIVDGTKRKDLIDKGLVEFQNIGKDHQVTVVFAKEGESKPEISDLYTITTGIGEGKGFIDSSLKVTKGSNHVVNWIPAEGYKVKTVILDGMIRDDLQETDHFEFENIQQSHSITVLFEKEEIVDAEKHEESFLIEVSREGKGTVSPSAMITRGQSYVVSWEAAEGYIVGRVEIDGVNCPELLNASSIELKNIGSSHKVNIVFDHIGGAIISPDEIVYVTTKLSGGLGSVTGSFTLEKGENVFIQWTAEKGYVFSKVLVNGVEVSSSGNSLRLDNVKEDMEIEVVLMSEKDLPQGTTNIPVVNTGDESQMNLIMMAMIIAMMGLLSNFLYRYHKQEIN